MAKSPKKSRRVTEPSPIEPDQLMDQLRASMLVGAQALHGRIEAISKKLKGSKYSQQDASHLAWLTKQAAQIMGEVRKLEEQEQRRIAKLSPGLVLAYLRQLEPDQRARLLREAQSIDAGASVLG